MPWLVLGIVFATVAILVTSGHAKSSNMSGPIDIKQSSVTMWDPALIPLALKYGIPTDYVRAWMAVESAGRACAIGDPKAKGPDGNPREIGLWQLYNPDDLSRFNVTGKELRAYCVPNSQAQSRRMTYEEILQHVDLGMQLITHCMKVAVGVLTKAGVSWPLDGKDLWRMAKLVHALPVIVNAVPTVAKHLGHPPQSWAEFRATYCALNPAAIYNPKLKEQTSYWRALENAERTGDFAVYDSRKQSKPNA